MSELTASDIKNLPIEYNPELINLNLESLKKNHYELALKVLDFLRHPERRRTSLIKSSDEQQFYSMLDGGSLMHSGVNPLKESNEIWNEITRCTNQSGIVFFLGFGLGYNLFSMLETRKFKFGSLVIIEKELEYFVNAISLFNMSQLFKNPLVKFFVGVPEDELYPQIYEFAFKSNLMVHIKTILPVIHKPSYFKNIEYYKRATIEFKTAMLACVTLYGNDPLDSAIGEENMFKNLRVIIENPGVNRLYNKFKGIPAVIVSSGPSLNDSVGLLKQAQNKALILCVDGSFKSLLSIGIEPHMVITQERGDSHKRLFDVRDKYPDLPNTWMVACPVQDPECYKVFPNDNHLVVYRTLKHFDWLGLDRGSLCSGSSVSHMAILLAEAFGCNPIILLGQDLCYGEGGKTHEDGAGEVATSFKNTFGDPKLRKMLVMGNSGQMVETHIKWNQFLKEMENIFNTVSKKSEVINAINPNKGARIAFTKVMPFEEVLNTRLITEYNISGMIRGNCIKTPSRVVEREFYRISKKILSAADDLHDIILGARDILKNIKILLDKPEKELQHPEVQAALKEIQKFKMNTLRKDSNVFEELVMHIIQSYVIALEMDLNHGYFMQKDIFKSDLNALKIQQKWFEIVIEMAECIEGMLRKNHETFKTWEF